MCTDSAGERGRVLIVEDEALIGLTLADLLRDEGFRVVGPVGTQSEAVATLDRVAVDAVILDLGLQDGVCVALARELRTRAVPFVVFSGHRRDSFEAAAFRDVPWFEKPGRADEIIAAMVACTASGATASVERIGTKSPLGKTPG